MPELIDAVWRKAAVVPGYEAGIWRRDACGAIIRRSDYANRQSEYGWEIDHVVPVALGGRDDFSNLQPLNWRNNAKKGDTHPWKCP